MAQPPLRPARSDLGAKLALSQAALRGAAFAVVPAPLFVDDIDGVAAYVFAASAASGLHFAACELGDGDTALHVLAAPWRATLTFGANSRAASVVLVAMDNTWRRVLYQDYCRGVPDPAPAATAQRELLLRVAATCGHTAGIDVARAAVGAYERGTVAVGLVVGGFRVVLADATKILLRLP
jgi:hypothetical protein